MQGTDILVKPGESPFDALRHTDAIGREYWLARDLMPHLGYEKWERFADAVDRARAACTNAGQDMGRNFRDVVSDSSKVPGVGNYGGIGQFGYIPRRDVELSRFGAYLTAMNGDPRKVEVAAAQTYFATSTRWAETAQQTGFALPKDFAEALELAARQQRALATVEAQAAYLRRQAAAIETRAVNAEETAIAAAREATEAQRQAEKLDGQLTATLGELGVALPKAEGYEAFLSTVGSYPLAVAAGLLGMGRQGLIQLLGQWKVLVMRPDSAEHLRPYAEHIHEGRFTVKATDVPITHRDGSKEVIMRGTTLVTPKGLDYIRRRMVREGTVIRVA